MTGPNYLTRADYLQRTSTLGGGHWANYKRRWSYHGAACGFAQVVGPASAERVLEMGTMGVNIVSGSHTIDYNDHWNFEGKQPTFVHDGRKIPWPVESDSYDLFIALRVFHHLAPSQKEAFAEAKRISRNIIIVTPESYDKVPGSAGIPLSNWVDWNEGVPPTAVMEIDEEFGALYFWDAKALGKA